MRTGLDAKGEGSKVRDGSSAETRARLTGATKPSLSTTWRV